MSDQPAGKSVPLSIGRKLVHEILHHARKVPSLPLARTCRIADVVAARQQVSPSPSWVAIFMRAYALVSRGHPELRRAWIPYPWARLYEHPHSECAVLIEREWQDEPTVLVGRVHAPECAPLDVLDDHLRCFQTADVWSVSPFRQLLRLGKLPWVLRRLAFSSSLYFSGFKRAKRFGTFTLSSLGNLGIEQIHPLTPLTTYLTFGPISPAGEVVVKVVYDHRVMDGRHVARALQALETTLNTDIVAELRAARTTAVLPFRRETAEPQTAREAA